MYKFDKEIHELYSYRSFIRDYDGAIREINVPKKELSEEAKDSITGNLPPRPDRVPFDRDQFYNISKEEEEEGEGEEESKLLSNRDNEGDQEMINDNSNFDSKMNLRGELSNGVRNRENSNLDESHQDKVIEENKSQSYDSDRGSEEEKGHFKKD